MAITNIFLLMCLLAFAIEAPTPKPKKLVFKLVSHQTKLAQHHPIYSALGYTNSLTRSSNHTFILVQLYLGQTRVPQYAVMDTGSGLLWMQCYDCDKENSPYYNPYVSPYYSGIQCDTQTCMDFPDNHCGDGRKCLFSASYVSGPTTTGTVGKDRITLVSDSFEQTIWDPPINFGCAYVSCSDKPQILLNDPIIRGIFGMGVGRASILAQMRYDRFSFCIGNLNAPNNQHDRLVFGSEEAYFAGEWMHLSLYNTHYFVELKELSFGNELIVNRSHLEIASNGGDVILDTASTYTYLSDDAYYPLEAMMMRQLSDKKRSWTMYSEICYSGIFQPDSLPDFPDVKLKFFGSPDARIKLRPESLFYQAYPKSFCFAFFPSSSQPKLGKRSVIGLLAQQNHNWAYDLRFMVVHFEPVRTCKPAS